MTDVKAVLDERGAKYGKFSEQAAIAQLLESAMRQGRNWQLLPAFQKEALKLITHKIARALNGDPTYTDNFIDIAGYAQLVVNVLEGKE